MIGKLTRTIVRTFAFALALCAAGGAFAVDYTMSNADGSAMRWDGGYNWNSGAIKFTLSNPSGVHASGDFPTSGTVALTRISISGRKDGNTSTLHHVVMTAANGKTYTSSSVEVLDGSSDSANIFTTTLASGGAYGSAGSYGQGGGMKTVNIYFDSVEVDVTSELTLATYTSASGTGQLGASVVASTTNGTNWKPAMRIYGKSISTATVAANGSWSTLSWSPDAPADWTAASATPVRVVVSDDCSIAIDTGVTVHDIVFDVADGKTLTLTGSSTITAANGIFVRGGSVVVPGAATLSGTVKGDGTVIYTAKPTTLTLTDADWNGVLWLKNVAVDAADPSTLAGENSVLRLTGCTGYFNPSTKMTCECLGTLDLQDDGATKAFTVNNGWSDSGITIFAKLTGDGSLVCNTRNISQRYVFKDASSFQGTINCVRSDTSGKYLRVILGDGSSLSPDVGTITVVAGATAAVGDGKTWSADKMVVNGSLTIGSGATVSKIASSSTGSVTVTSGTGTVSGVDGAEFPATIVVYPSATLVIADTSATALKIPAEFVSLSDFTYYNQGTLDLTGCTALMTLYLDMGSSTTFNLANVSLPATCTTVAVDVGEPRSLSGYTVTKAASGQDDVTIDYLVEETKEEYGNGSLEVTDVPEGATVYVLRADGTTVTANVTDTTARLSDYGTVKITGAATAYDVDFAYTGNPLQYKTSSGATLYNVTQIESDWYNYSAADKTTGLKVNKTPYIGGISEFSTLQQEMTLAVVGQMPSVQDNAIFIHLGGSSDTNKGFLIYRLAEDDKVAVAYNVGHDVTDLTTMTVPNAATARHVYIITKVDDTTADKSIFTIYLDGVKWKTQEVSPVLSMSGGVQIGSDFQARIRASDQANGMRIKRVMPSGAAADTAVDTTGYVNVIRLYDRIITATEIAAYSASGEYPYVSPIGSSVRTFETAAEDWVEATDTDWTNTDSSGDVTSGTAPTAGASVTVTASTATEISVNLDSETSYEALTINGSAVTLASGGSGDIKVTGMTVIGAPVTVEYGAADFTGGPMTITEDGSITFDYSDYDISEIYTTTNITLTSEVAEYEGKVFLTPPSASYRTVSLVYTSGHYAMRVTPNHEDGAEVYFRSGYLKGNMAVTGSGEVYVDSSFTTRTALFPNDVMVVNDISDLWQDQLFMDTSFAGNIRFSRTTAATLRNGEVAGTFLAGCTVTVDEGCSLTIARHSSGNYALTLADVTVNGTGTATLSDPMSVSGAVSGTAALTISGTVNVASGGSIANAITGAGELAYLTPADVPATSLTFSAWTGTVALPAVTSGASGLNLNNYGVNGSTVSIAGISSGAWLVNEVVAPTVEITGDMTLSAFSATFANTFNKLSGSRAFSLTADGTADGYADGYFLIKDVSEFTGSITVAAPGLALGGTSKPSSTEWYGKIVVQAPVTVGSGATWSARGVVLSATTATLTVPDGATVPTVTSGVAGYEVKTETVGDNTVYSLLKRGTIFSVW